MRRILLGLIIAAGLLTTAGTQAQPAACARPGDTPPQQGQVLCCCRSGNACCAWVYFCTGQAIPGCFC